MVPQASAATLSVSPVQGGRLYSHPALVPGVPGRMVTSPTLTVTNTTSVMMELPTCIIVLVGWCLPQTRGGAPGLRRQTDPAADQRKSLTLSALRLVLVSILAIRTLQVDQ